jgi:preprotein translocase subunit SecF
MNIFVNANFNIMGKRRFWITLSLILIAIGIVSIFLHGGLNYGIDFAGGTIVQVKFSKDLTAEDIRSELKDTDFGTYAIQSIGSPKEHEFLLRFAAVSEASVEDTSAKKLSSSFEEKFPKNPDGTDQFEIRKIESVGPAIGKELRMSALGAIIAAMIMMLIYITFRFEFKYGVGAIIALFHDVMIALGAVSIANREIDMPAIAAFLTIVGYSVNDTIVVFDRVRENMRLLHREKAEDIFNTSINQTLSRTILTSSTVAIVLISMLLLGGEVLRTFSLALLVGVITGTYSSIYIASPYAMWCATIQERGKGKTSKQPAQS